MTVLETLGEIAIVCDGLTEVNILKDLIEMSNNTESMRFLINKVR
jgi:hypothetical protein